MTVALSSPSRTAFPLRKIIGQGQLHGEGVAVVDAVDEELGGHAAISSMGMCIVVSMGEIYCAMSISSMLITAISFGM